MKSPIDLPAAEYTSDDEYGDAVYTKAALWMYRLELLVGRDKMSKAIQNFFFAWKFRHPYPDDFKECLEKVTGKNLDDYFGQLRKKGSLR